MHRISLLQDVVVKAHRPTPHRSFYKKGWDSMTYPDAIQFLYDLQMFGAKFGLENTFKLAQLAGDPQKNIRFIHVAGTNGKGSTCAMLESIYRRAGFKVGLFTSPHLVSFAERIQVNRELIAEADVVRLVEQMRGLLKTFPREAHPTFFEVVAVMALRYFAEQGCELVIWETGMGGRLDATNIVTPLASVITNVQLDHQKWLGETIEQIAFEKAGIIKPGVPIITAEDKPAALRVIEAVAQKSHAPFKTVTRLEQLPGDLHLSLLGEHQRTNAALALATVDILQQVLPVDSDATRRGLETVFWPARLQLITRPSGQKVLLDGAHNVAGAETLRQTVREQFASEKITLIMGALRDKQFTDICAMLAPLSDDIYLVPVTTARTVAPTELIPACSNANPTAAVHPADSLAHALESTKKAPFLLITGSLYLMGEATELLGISPARNERGLNEWSTNTATRS